MAKAHSRPLLFGATSTRKVHDHPAHAWPYAFAATWLGWRPIIHPAPAIKYSETYGLAARPDDDIIIMMHDVIVMSSLSDCISVSQVSSQVKCIDISQRSVTLVIANPHRFVCEELHTLPKALDQCYLGRRHHGSVW
jgi:hypothetical protein